MTTAVSPPPGSAPQMLPVPDPTLLTTAQLVREIDHLRSLIEKDLAVRDQRFEGIDRATDLLNEQMTRVPTETDLKTGQLKELVQRDIQAIYAILDEREKRTKEAADLNVTALQAAFKAQQESAAVSAQGLRENIAKNETLANQLIASQGALIATLQGDVSDLRTEIRGLIKERAGSREQVFDSRASSGRNGQWVAIGISAVAVLLVILGMYLRTQPI